MLLPKTKFASKKNQIIVITILMLIPIIANLAWLKVSSSYLAEYEEARPVGQLEKLIKNPLEYIEMLIYTIDSNGTKYFTSTFGGEVRTK